MSSDRNKELVRRYMQAIDDNQTSDWSVIDDYLAEDFVAHNPAFPGVSLDREGMKEAAEKFRLATPGRHEVTMQIAEDDLVASLIRGRGTHAAESSVSPRRTRRSRRRASRSTASETARSSNIGRSPTWRVFFSRSVPCPGRTAEASAGSPSPPRAMP